MNLNQIRASLLAGDNEALHYIYVEYGNFCIRKLMRQRSCSMEDAEDLFIESVINFRSKVLNGEIERLTGLGFYLYKTCENKYLARLKDEKSRNRKLPDIERYFYGSTYVSSVNSDFDNYESEATQHAWSKLTEKCKDIIYHFYVDKLSMDTIAELMGLASGNVAKTTKARCYKHFLTYAKAFYKNKTRKH